MTSAISPSAPNPLNAQQPSDASPAASGTTTPLSGAVPAQLPVRSYASATKTATQSPPTPAGASAPTQNAKPATESPVNGVPGMAQGGSQAASAVSNSTPNTDHGRKASLVISASGASGYTSNGGPVAQNGRPHGVAFGSFNSQGGSPMPPASVPYQSQTSSLPAPPRDPRVISPAHSPSPIPQPPVSGGRPPSGFQNQMNGPTPTFGSTGAGSEQMQQSQMMQGPPLGPGINMHERRQSSQSMHADPNMNRNFMPQNGRGRGFPPQPYGMGSPAQSYRPPPGQPRAGPNMPPQFQQQIPPNSPYNRGRNSPAIQHQQPGMPQQHMAGNPQMGYGAYQQMGPQQHPQNMYQQFDPQSGYYQPFYPQAYGQYPAQQSPRPQYPSPYPVPPAQMQPPFNPPNMSRNSSQASERPASGMGQPQTPSMPHPQPSQTPASNQQPQTAQANFVRPKKASSAIKITDAQGNEVNFNKPATPNTTTQPQTPVIVSTPSAPTPPPRAPSNQHNRTESKSTMTAEERKNAFQEQINQKRKADEAEAAKAMQETEPKTEKEVPASETAVDDTVKEATAEAEKAAAVDAGDKEGEKDADAALSDVGKKEDEKDEHEETEEERKEREFAEMEAEMEAKEREEEEREKAYQEKKKKEREEAAKKEAEEAAKADEELKRQEREAEEREEQREREREADKESHEADEQAREMFASLKKSQLGPGASTPASGTETPASEEAEPSPVPQPAQPATATQPRAAGAAKPRPANLKLETSKRVEPAEPTPGMQALKSARFLEVNEEPKYPDGFKSPNPAVNVNGSRRARAYDKAFLLQFQSVFREKPSVDWDQKVRETLGPSDEAGSGRPQSARTPSANMNRAASGRPGQQGIPNFQGVMGSFGSGPPRTLPPNTTSEQRFAASQQQAMRPGMHNVPQMARGPSQFGMPPQVNMSRTNSLANMGHMVPGSPKAPSARGAKGGSRRGDRAMSKKEEAELAAKMPLTAHMEVAPLEKSTTGWKATSLGQPLASQHDLSGNIPPDMVQRKVKAALNKMTPEKFEKISDQILEIAGQSKNESDGRTLRQVIQLTFEKACDEAHWAGMYAQFCHKMLTTMSPEIRDETIKDKNGNPVVGGALFRKYLLNRCQEEFERGWQVNLPEKPEGESQEAALLSDEYYIAAAAKRRGLGLIQFIGQLYKLRMLTLRIMHECVMKLLNFEGDPDEAAVENLTTLLKSVGATMEEDDQGQQFMNAYFERIDSVILKSDALPSRPKFMIMDLIDLRKSGWKGKGDSKGPKTITQIHEEAEAAARAAEAERQRTAQRGGAPGGRPPPGRDGRQFSGGMPPPDYQRNLVGADDLRRLQARGQSQRQTGGGLGPGGGIGPSSLGMRSNSRRGAGNLGPPSSGNTTRTNTPPVDNTQKKEEASSQNAFGALASLDSGEAHEDTASRSEAASPPTRTKSPLAATEATDES